MGKVASSNTREDICIKLFLGTLEKKTVSAYFQVQNNQHNSIK